VAKPALGRKRGGARRVAEALKILKALTVPREQQNERSALTLLALLGLTPDKPWSEAEAPLLGITEMMRLPGWQESAALIW
jgi:adenine-specific DNA-methyltransferase